MNAYHLVLLSMFPLAPLAAQAQGAGQMGLDQCAAQLIYQKGDIWKKHVDLLEVDADSGTRKSSGIRRFFLDRVTIETDYGTGSTFIQEGNRDWRIKNKDPEWSFNLKYSLPLGTVFPPKKVERAHFEDKAAFYDLIHDASIAALETMQKQATARAPGADQEAALAASLAFAKLEKLLDRIENLTRDFQRPYGCRRPD
ncbi:hypothetical protein [Xanthomonas sacchari]|uniref:hypothetical protein n=1 Tax=Xanthomonas sacchari TaxID=56458 RepID=UPI0027D80A39|nr:hypothetical protein [Xanthomonas sacchari]